MIICDMAQPIGKNVRISVWVEGLGFSEIGVQPNRVAIPARRMTWSIHQSASAAPLFLRPWLDCVDAYAVIRIKVSRSGARYKLKLYRAGREVGEIEVDGPGGLT